ncbi:MAG: hypothetical protein U0841_12980 [Chloroflexia bacterium]
MLAAIGALLLVGLRRTGSPVAPANQARTQAAYPYEGMIIGFEEIGNGRDGRGAFRSIDFAFEIQPPGEAPYQTRTSWKVYARSAQALQLGRTVAIKVDLDEMTCPASNGHDCANPAPPEHRRPITADRRRPHSLHLPPSSHPRKTARTTSSTSNQRGTLNNEADHVGDDSPLAIAPRHAARLPQLQISGRLTGSPGSADSRAPSALTASTTRGISEQARRLAQWAAVAKAINNAEHRAWQGTIDPGRQTQPGVRAQRSRQIVGLVEVATPPQELRHNGGENAIEAVGAAHAFICRADRINENLQNSAPDEHILTLDPALGTTVKRVESPRRPTTPGWTIRPAPGHVSTWANPFKFAVHHRCRVPPKAQPAARDRRRSPRRRIPRQSRR